MAHLWQHPYVNVFKHFDISTWKKSTKEGEVMTIMDKALKCTVYRITGSIPAGNYIQIPSTSTQSLGLTGRYLYVLFRPIPSKYFVVHIDVATHDALVVRISFSNLFKEFKSTSTWLQFPFICHAARGTIDGNSKFSGKDSSGPAPLSTRWTLLCLDVQYILSMYLNRQFSYTKNIKLCANMFVKNIFTSDLLYQPGLTFEQATKSGSLSQGINPLPRDMAFHLTKGQNWKNIYDLIRFPSSGTTKPFDSIQFSESSPPPSKNGPPGIISPKRVNTKQTDLSRPQKGSNPSSAIHYVTKPDKTRKKPQITKELPTVGLDSHVNYPHDDDREIHVYAHPLDSKAHLKQDRVTEKINFNQSNNQKVKKSRSYKSLQPDPILQLKRIVGFGGSTSTCREALWNYNGSIIVYPCHAVLVAMQVANGHQRFFIGHTDKISCLAMNSTSSLVASGQTGQLSVVRVWKFQTAECLAMVKTHTNSLTCLSFSRTGSVLCGVGKDGHGKNMVVVWNTLRVTNGGEVIVIAKAHTEVDIQRMRVAHFDETRMVSCGRDNIRFWRVRDGQLRSAPVNLGEHHCMEFTDCCFEKGNQPGKDSTDRILYVCSRSGHIFEIDYQKVCIQQVRRLLPADKKRQPEKQTFNSGAGISINSIAVNEAFCLTGSDDGYLRLWPFDFKHVFLEAEHEGPVTAVDITEDGLKLLAGTSTGNLGVLDTSTRSYTTLMRSHMDRIVSTSIDPSRQHMVTISQDHTIRVWNIQTMQQLYDFSSPQECPSSVVYHPSKEIFACGFDNGCVRVFNVATTSLLAEHKHHRGSVTGVSFSLTGDFLYSAGSLGSMAIYDSSDNMYTLIRLLSNMVARGEKFGPNSIAVSPEGHHIAVIGPSDFTVSVLDARSLDEILRIDITSLNAATNNRTIIDTALRLCYSPSSVHQLLVTTTSNKLLKFDSKNGRLLSEVDNIHRSGCTSLEVSRDGLYLVTAGDRVIKIWDYHMRLDLNFQVFIGHSEAVSRVVFTPDSLSVITVGEAIFLWDFLANIHKKQITQPEGRTPIKSLLPREDAEREEILYKSPVRRSLDMSVSDMPRRTPAPQPVRYDQLDDAHSTMDGDEEIQVDTNLPETDNEEVLKGPELNEIETGDTTDLDSVIEIEGHETQGETLGHSPKVQPHERYRLPTRSPAKAADRQSQHRSDKARAKPHVHKHYTKRPRSHGLAQRRYAAPDKQAGLTMKAVISYNGDGRNNMIWQPDTGLFMYTSGCLAIVEDLNSGEQRFLTGHVEEISTLALQNDCQVLASASGSHGTLTPSQIFLWDLQHMTCKHILRYHSHEITALAYSRDDKYLVSIGDYQECCVVLWSMYTHSVITTSTPGLPIHDVKWDPYSPCEFVTVGQNGSILFWMIDESLADGQLQVHDAEVPEDLLQTHHMGVGQVDFTALAYAGDNLLFIATNNGKVSAWDTRHNSCFMHWEADTTEIGCLVSYSGRLISASVGRNLRLWSTVGIAEMKLPGDHHSMRSGGLVMDDEMNLDGPITCVVFDATMDMGIVGTSSGTLWYICWTERSSVRLVSSHMDKINDLAIINDNFIATCANDGSLRVWSLMEREQTLQFQVIDQACTCLDVSPQDTQTKSRNTLSNIDTVPVMAHSLTDEDRIVLPSIAAGYSDGTVRLFDINQVEMVLKIHPHAVSVTALTFSSNGCMLLSGASDGIIAISSPTTGMTVRLINDHKGAPISNFDVSKRQNMNLSKSATEMWMASSSDRRVSVWSADWTKDYCELIDWLSFSAPAFTPDGVVIKKGDESFYSQLPPSIARFSKQEPDIIVYVGYGMQKQVQFYSISKRKVVRTIALTHWASHLDLSLHDNLLAVGINERLVKLIDYHEGSFQDYTGHSDIVQLVKFCANTKTLFTVGYSEILMWHVQV